VGSIEGGARGRPARLLWEGGRAGRRLARGTFRRLDLDQHRAAKGFPPAGLRGLPQDRSPPHICDASRAPLVGPGCTRDSPDDTPCQEQSENVTSRPRTTSPSSPSLVTTGLVPVIPMDRSAVPHRIGMAGTRPAMTAERVSDGDIPISARGPLETGSIIATCCLAIHLRPRGNIEVTWSWPRWLRSSAFRTPACRPEQP
jgi:hypothetical protein